MRDYPAFSLFTFRSTLSEHWLLHYFIMCCFFLTFIVVCAPPLTFSLPSAWLFLRHLLISRSRGLVFSKNLHFFHNLFAYIKILLYLCAENLRWRDMSLRLGWIFRHIDSVYWRFVFDKTKTSNFQNQVWTKVSNRCLWVWHIPSFAVSKQSCLSYRRRFPVVYLTL